MKTIYLFSNKQSVLKYWQAHIDDTYHIEIFNSIENLYDALNNKVPDIVFFDYDGTVAAAIELLAFLRKEGMKSKVMALNGRPLFADGVALLRNGARAFINTYAAPANINRAVESVLDGNIWLYPEFVTSMIKQSVFEQVKNERMLQNLSSREKEIAHLIGLGMSNREIADNTGITEQTVKTHLKTIYEKVGVNTRLELAIVLNREGNSYQRGIAGDTQKIL